MFDRNAYYKKHYRLNTLAALLYRGLCYELNRVKELACRAQYYRLNRKAELKYGRKYNRLNKFAAMERNKKYHQLHKKEINDWHRKYIQTSTGKLANRLKMHNRRTKTKGTRLAVIQQVYEENIQKFKTLTCELCLKPVRFGNDSLEHFTPLSRGGTNDRGNLGVAHERCNNLKSTRTLNEYKELLKCSL